MLLQLTYQLNTARQKLRQKEFAAAEALVRNILYEEPDFPEALCLMGIILTETGRQPEALKVLRYLFILDDTNPAAWEAYGCAHLRLHSYSQAEAAFLRALEIDDKLASTLRNLGVLYSLQHRNVQCYEVLKKAERLDPDDLLTMYALSSAHLQFGNQAAARELLERLVADSVPADIREYARQALAQLA